MFTKLLLFVLLRSSSAVIYELEDEDYALMPPLFLLDDYEVCLDDPEGLYCTADFVVVSEEPSPLLTMMQEYSEHTPTHYNHTVLHRGICITSTCKKFYKKSKEDLKSALEACTNATLHSKYKLKARVSDDVACSKREKFQSMDYVEMAVGWFCIAILLINIVATFNDYISIKEKYEKGFRYLYCFSILRNWNKLLATPADGRDPRLRRLRGLHGIRVLTMVLVTSGHSIVSCVFLPEDAKVIENVFIAGPFHFLLNGTLIMQTFLVIASFLLVYNWLIYSEKYEPSWKMLPKQFMMRWLRLTPSYAVILALTATWIGRIATGPYWKRVIGNELSDCRRDWWKHLLYINNYFDNSECMPQSWFLAADTQLYFMAATIFVTCRTFRTRKVVLSLLFVLGILASPLHTYFQDLDGVLIVSPELALNIFKNSPTFNKIYKRGHTNLTGYVIGMAMGYWLYEWQKSGGNPKVFRKYRFLYWTLFPIGCMYCYCGTIFYTYSPRPSLFVDLLFATFLKPVFGITVGMVIIGVIIKFEGIYRTVLELPIWTAPSRLTFSAYLLHVAFLKNLMAMQTTTYKATTSVFVSSCLTLTMVSFIAAFFFWMLVEAPLGNLIREFFTKPEADEGSKVANDLKRKEDASPRNNGRDKITDNTLRRRVIGR